MNIYMNRLLKHAVDVGDLDVVKDLLNEGSDVNGIDPENHMYPVHLAIFNGDAEMLKLLLDNGADTTVLLQNTATLLEAAVMYRKDDCVEVLVENGCPVDMLVILKIDRLTSERTRRLLYSKVDVHEVCVVGPKAYSALHWAAKRKDAMACEILIQRGADINLRVGRLAETPLYKASSWSVIKVLLENGADPNSKWRGGFSAFEIFTTDGKVGRKYSRLDYMKMLELYYKHGADFKESMLVLELLWKWEIHHFFDGIFGVIAKAGGAEWRDKRFTKEVMNERMDACFRELDRKVWGKIKMSEFIEMSDAGMRMLVKNQRAVRYIQKGQPRCIEECRIYGGYVRETFARFNVLVEQERKIESAAVVLRMLVPPLIMLDGVARKIVQYLDMDTVDNLNLTEHLIP